MTGPGEELDGDRLCVWVVRQPCVREMKGGFVFSAGAREADKRRGPGRARDREHGGRQALCYLGLVRKRSITAVSQTLLVLGTNG